MDAPRNSGYALQRYVAKNLLKSLGIVTKTVVKTISEYKFTGMMTFPNEARAK